MIDKYEIFNTEILKYSILNEKNSKIISFLGNNIKVDFIYKLSRKLYETLIDINQPLNSNLFEPSQYKEKNINELRELLIMVSDTKIKIDKKDMLDFIRVWYLRTQTNEDIHNTIQPEYNRIITSDNCVNWEYIEKKLLG